MRKPIVALVLFFAIVVAFIVAAASLRSRVASVAPALANDIAEKIGAKIEIGDVSVSLFPPSARVRNVRVTDRDRSRSPFLVLDALRVDVAFRSLLQGSLHVRDVWAEKPRLEVVRDEQGGQVSLVSEDFLARLAKTPFLAHVADGEVLLEDRTVTPAVRLAATGVGGALESGSGGALAAKLFGRVLDSTEDATLDFELTPDVGPTGGDRLSFDLKVKGGRVQALKDAIVAFRGAALIDPVVIELQGARLLGEKSTEARPVEALPGKVKVSIGAEIGGTSGVVEIEAETAIDDTRFHVRRGRASWADFVCEPTGWVMLRSPYEVSARIVAAPFDLASAAERFGFAERFRPKGTMSTTIRVTGNAGEQLVLRHAGEVKALEFNAWPVIPIKASSVGVKGALVAINTDVSASLGVSSLEVGTLRLDVARAGLTYWKDKLSLSFQDMPFYDGIALGSVSYWPATAEGPQGGLMVRNADAEAVLHNFAPRLALDLSGRIDSISQLRWDDSGLLVRGRAGVHSGRVAGPNWIRTLVAEALTHAGRGDALASIAGKAATALADAGTRFRRVAVDYETRDGTVRLPRVVLTTDGAEIRASGEIALDGSVSLDGFLHARDELARAIVDTVPALGAIRSSAGALVIPFALRAHDAGSTIATTPEYRDRVAASLAGRAVSPLEIVRVPVAQYEGVLTLQKQFAR